MSKFLVFSETPRFPGRCKLASVFFPLLVTAEQEDANTDVTSCTKGTAEMLAVISTSALGVRLQIQVPRSARTDWMDTNYTFFVVVSRFGAERSVMSR